MYLYVQLNHFIKVKYDNLVLFQQSFNLCKVEIIAGDTKLQDAAVVIYSNCSK